MTDSWIDDLTVLGTGTEKAFATVKAAESGLILARGQGAVNWLAEMGFKAVEVFSLANQTSDGVQNWREQLRSLLKATGTERAVLYVTPIYPQYLDQVAVELTGVSRSVEWSAGSEWFGTQLPFEEESLDGALQSLDILRVHAAHYPIFSSVLPVMLHTAGVRLDGERLFQVLSQVYPSDHKIYVEDELPGADLLWRSLRLEELKEIPLMLSAIFIPPCTSDSSLESFMQLIAQLRAPDGCPWDRKQTHASLRPYLMEETYEALERLDNNDMEGLKEELGDLLLQIALHSQIASENNTFTITQVLQHINRKIVSRHPHVFGAVRVNDDRDVVQNWEKLKEIERAGKGKEENNGLLDGIPQILPALSQAQSIQERAARVGFDWPEITPVIAKVLEEMQEVREAVNEREQAQELGDLLFAVVNLVRWYRVDAESALRGTITKFRKRFSHIEAEARKSGKDLQQMTLEEMDVLWEASKEFDEE